MADDEQPEVLDLGLVDAPDDGDDRKHPVGARPALPRRRVLTLGGLLAVAGGLLVQSRTSPTVTAPLPAAPVPAPPPVRLGRRAPPPPVSVTDVGHPLLGGP